MITLKQFEDALKGTIDRELKRSLMVLGPTGVGKSEIIHQVAASYSMKVIDIRLLLWSLTDLKGIPYPDDSHRFTKWLINDVLPRPERDGDKGILLLEELNAAPKAVQAAAYQLTLDRKIGDYTLSDGWYIVATGNREQDNGIYIAPPAPLADRFEIHEIGVDFATWRDYAVKAGYNPSVISYLSANPQALYTFKPEASAELVFATPRSWVAVCALLDAGFTKDVLKIKIEGNIGAVEAAGFMHYLKNTSLLPNIDSVLEGDYTKNGSKVAFLATLDVYYLLIQNLIYSVRAEFDKQSDKWRLYINNSLDFICGISNFPLELKKSYVDQLRELDDKTSQYIRQYICCGSRSQSVSLLLQELDYIK